jgi:hypothetical protein
MGRPCRLVGLHAERPGACALEGSTLGGPFSFFYPCVAPLSGMVCAAEPSATSPALTVKPGASRGIRATARVAMLQKQEGVETLAARATNPIRVFFPLSSASGRGRRRRGRRGGGGFDLEVRFTFVGVPQGWGQEPEPREPFVGAGTPRHTGVERSRTPEPGVRTTSPSRTAISVKPAMTPSPTQSEKDTAFLPFPPPWSLSCDAPMASRRAAM